MIDFNKFPKKFRKDIAALITVDNVYLLSKKRERLTNKARLFDTAKEHIGDDDSMVEVLKGMGLTKEERELAIILNIEL